MTPELRQALSEDAPALGDILWRFQIAHDWMPELHSLLDCIRFCEVMIARGWVTVATIGEDVRGFLARDGAEICALYLARRAGRQGVGKLLMDDAKRASPELWLRCFEANSGARRFYRRQGFVEAARGDGRDNEENLPDITFVWPAEAAQ